MDDVIILESSDEEFASEDLNILVDNIFDKRGSFGNRMLIIKYLRSLWDNESWQSIKKKLLTEGSIWYVWYMDGVRQHLINIRKQED